MTGALSRAVDRQNARHGVFFMAVRSVFRRQAPGEQAIMLNRLLLAAAVLSAAALLAYAGSAPARDFYRQGLPWLQAYLLVTAAIEAHILLRPAPTPWRQGLAIACDAAAISFGLHQGDGASAWLFPLYFWMILGNGVRLGAKYMGVAVVSAAAGFVATFVSTPFWRDDAALSAALFLSIVIIPAYGALCCGGRRRRAPKRSGPTTPRPCCLPASAMNCARR